MEDCGSLIEFDVPEFSNTVLNQLNELRLQGKLCDIIVHIQGQPFRAHKAVLAASSPYFRDHSSLGTMSGLSISVIKSPEVFEQLLAFCYTGRMSLRLRDVISFLTAASFLQMQAVIDKCTQILEGIHSKISVPVPTGIDPDNDCTTSRAVRNGVKDGGIFVNPTQISPPYYSRQNHCGEGRSSGKGVAEEGQSDRGSSDSISEQEVSMEVESEQVDLIGKDGQVTDVHIKLEKTDRPYSDSSSAGDDGYHTELVDGEQVLAVSVGSYGPVLSSAAYTYSALPSSCFVSLSSSSPSRSLLSSVRGGRARPKRPVPLQADLLTQLKPGATEGDPPATATTFENDVRERSFRGQWYPYNERLICIYCGKSFNQKGSLDRHMRLHMGITPFVCKFCGKKYTRKDQLEYHIRGHTDNKPFHCQICGKCFPFQGTLNQHLRKKHMTSGTDVNNHTDLLGEAPDGQRAEQEDASEGEAACVAAYPDDLSTKTPSEESGKCSPEETPQSKPLRGHRE
ncbi:zinc finger and BTB domain-containing protein 34-like [Carassius auratus]|uniref:Zinc finger and BTB domain-containing protein 34-like n=1 Tax=Carassius auratus TaxID=7957 RepID=A0A6P6PYF1_CARAU|nr:zinc finger and BTB domain-containing protein 34-like [Carassius auratus]XP_026126183.1 zinc finger and BTB domain-containing protein 34-like [Carassius auratus]